MISAVHKFRYGTTSTDGQPLSQLSGRGCAGETINLSLAMLSDKNYNDVEVTASALKGVREEIPESNVGLFVVTSRWKSGASAVKGQPVVLEELLLKDDRVSLADSYVRDYQEWGDAVKAVLVYSAPNVRLAGPVQTFLQAGVQKHLWLSIVVPDNLSPGTYTGSVLVNVVKADTDAANGTVSDRSGGYECLTFDLDVQVYPFQLSQPRQQLMIWYKGTLDRERSSQHCVDSDRMLCQLSDISAHGFNAVSLNESNTALVARGVEVASKAAVDNLLVFTPGFPDASVLPPNAVYYISDEPDLHADLETMSGAAIDMHKKNALRAAKAGAPTMVSLASASAANRLYGEKGIGPAPDIISLLQPANKLFFLLRDQLAVFQKSKLFYYWICSIEAPNWNRVLAGFYLVASGADGISPYCYQHMPVPNSSPFNDFDDWEPDFTIRGEKSAFRHHMTAYPARNGIISTLQWEALRDGITDLKYFTTLEDLIKAAKSSTSAQTLDCVSRAQLLIDAILMALKPADLGAKHDALHQPFEAVDCEQYDLWRHQIGKLCTELTHLLEPAHTVDSQYSADNVLGGL